MPITTLSPFLTVPLCLVFALAGVFLLLLVRPLWRTDEAQRPDHVLPCRVASVGLAWVGAVLCALAIAYGHSALYSWGVL